jgi:hypothetical protein
LNKDKTPISGATTSHNIAITNSSNVNLASRRCCWIERVFLIFFFIEDEPPGKIMSRANDLYLVSACLVGLCTRYDGKTKPHQECLDRLSNTTWIPICPEQLG